MGLEGGIGTPRPVPMGSRGTPLSPVKAAPAPGQFSGLDGVQAARWGGLRGAGVPKNSPGECGRSTDRASLGPSSITSGARFRAETVLLWHVLAPPLTQLPSWGQSPLLLHCLSHASAPGTTPNSPGLCGMKASTLSCPESGLRDGGLEEAEQRPWFLPLE